MHKNKKYTDTDTVIDIFDLSTTGDLFISHI